MNAQNFTQKTLEMLQTAKSMAMENNNQYISPEHLLYALVDQDGGLIPSFLAYICLTKLVVGNLLKSSK